MTREIAIKTAAKWWTDKLRQRAPHDNGDNSRNSAFAMILADMLTTPMSEEQLIHFQKALEGVIDHELKENREHRAGLFCDYGPDQDLCDAAMQAGINVNNFPYKTGMFIEKNGNSYTVLVSDGYAQPYERIKPCE